MFFIDTIILLGGLLILAAILTRTLLARFGVPVLVLFLFVGMMAGSEGIGGIDFADYELAHAIGTLALAAILYVGGLTTPLEMLRLAWKPALPLSTIGVVMTAFITGTAAIYVFGMSLLQGMLLGSIVASTDAAAVFSILRSQKQGLDARLQATVEVESGSNDPMAIVLTIAFIGLLTGDGSSGIDLIRFFVLQMGVGLVAGFAAGKATAWIINRIHLDAAGLYPVLVLTLGYVAFGATVYLGGSGFLAIYVCGIVVGNSRMVFHRGTLLFHDAIAWGAQITMFVVLGLVSFPSQVQQFTWGGLVLAFVLIFVARPLTVFLLAWPFGFTFREMIFISWAGIKGAVPIVLATYPLMMGVDNAMAYFNAVFFVVLVSALLQGWSLPVVARWLKLDRPLPVEPEAALDIMSLHHLNAEIVDFRVAEDSYVAHLRVNELDLPEGVVIAMLGRGREIIPARGPTVILPQDHVFIIATRALRKEVEAFFNRKRGPSLPLRAGILLPATCSLKTIADLYGVELNGAADQSVGDFLDSITSGTLEEGTFSEIDDYRLYVQAVDSEGRMIIGLEPMD